MPTSSASTPTLLMMASSLTPRMLMVVVTANKINAMTISRRVLLVSQPKIVAMTGGTTNSTDAIVVPPVIATINDRRHHELDRRNRGHLRNEVDPAVHPGDVATGDL